MASAAAADFEKWKSFYEGQERLFDRPLLLSANVVHGYNRGSKELGIPTANLSMEQLGAKGDMNPGIYFGFARLNSATYEAVVSVGWNPYYKNTVKTVEAHLLSTMEDFYGETLEVLLCGFLRFEQNFSSLDDLISCIQTDIEKSKHHLATLSSQYKELETWAEFD